MLPALLAMFALLYLLSAHDAMVMGHLRSINRDRTPIIESYKNLITDKKHGFVAVASLMGENLQYAALSEQPPTERARTLFKKNKEIARIAFYPKGSFEELGTDTSYETPPLPLIPEGEKGAPWRKVPVRLTHKGD